MRSLLIILLVFLMGVRANSQTYEVKYSTNSFNNWSITTTESLDYKIISDIESKYINGDGMLIITGRPKEIEVISYEIEVDLTGDILYLCEPPSQIIALTSTECINYFNNSLITSCSAGLVNLQIDVTPVLAFMANTSPKNDSNGSIPYCITEPVRLVASPGFSSYIWQYLIENQGWQNFNPGTGNDVSFTLQEVIGSQADNYLNKSALFRYNVGNCPATAASPELTYIFTIPPPVVSEVNPISPTCFAGSDGTVSIVALNRSLLAGERIIYDLFDETSSPITQNESGNFSNLVSGQYSISIQANSFSYCTTSGPLYDFQIANSPQVSFTTSNAQSVLCYNTSTGSININPSGGTGSGFEYSIDGNPFNNTSTLSNLSVGDHIVTVKDSNGCTYSNTINISGPSAVLSAYIDILSDYNGSPLSCATAADATINIVASNGWGNYKFSTAQNGTYLNTGTFSNLSAGIQTFWIRDSEGCIISRDVIISPPTNIEVNDIVVTTPQCAGDAGSFIINASGGTGIIQYSLDNNSFQASFRFFVSAGTYNVYLIDDNGCSKRSSDIIVQDPDPIVYTTVISEVSCNKGQDGSITIKNVNNGVQPYQYSINGGVTYAATTTFSNIQSGIYDIVVKDNNGCLSTSSVIVSEPDKVTGIINETPILCNGENNGSLSAIGAGGFGTYSYLWSNGLTTKQISNLNAGSYSVVITDQNGCESNLLSYLIIEPAEIIVNPLSIVINGYEISCYGASDGTVDLAVIGGSISDDYTYLWSNGQTSSSLTNAVAGQYSVKVTDDNGCFTESTIEITDPQALVFTEIIVNDVSCYQGSDGKLQISTSGGVGQHRYSIDAGVYEPINSINNLSSGNHTVSVIDINGCEYISTFSIAEPEKIAIKFEGTKNAFCGQANGSIDITVTGGVKPYQYNWQNSFNEPVSDREDLENFSSGSYSILITDANGCTQLLNSTISNSDGPAIQVESITGTSCFDSADGNATISVTGGVPPYDINWQNGETGTSAMNLIKGIVQVSVEDNSGCISFMMLDIPGKDEIEILDINLTQPSCFGDNNGAISVSVKGGLEPYYYNWSNGEKTTTIINLRAGIYELTIVDKNDCSLSQTIILNEREPISIDYEAFAPSCTNNTDGSISLVLSGGMAPYEIYQDNILIGSNYIQNLSAGSYSILARDANGCSKTSVITVPNATPWNIILEDLIICEGQEVSLMAPIEADSYRWFYQSDLISTENNITITQEGQYDLEVVNVSGCVGQGSFKVSTSTEVLKGDFLMSSKAYIGDTVIIIDITFPLPDSINWLIPTSVEVIEANKDLAMLVFGSSGFYNIGFEAFLGYCTDKYAASIEILEASETPINGRLAGDTDPVILSLEVYPNPNNGTFDVEGLFRKSQPAKLKLIYLLTNQVVIEESRPSNMEHYFQINLLNLAAGFYAVIIQTADEVKIVRMIKR